MQKILNRPTLTDGPVSLRAPRSEDAQARFRLGHKPEIHHMFGADPKAVRPITKAEATAWLHRQEIEPLAWIICYRKRMIGALRLHSLHSHDRRASLAIGILDPKMLGKGVGTRAMRLIAGHAFNALGLNRLTVRVLDFNSRAIAAYEKVGFVIEGRERQAARVGDDWHDDIIMGLIAEDFRLSRAA